jgi:hypothetical protein
VSFFLLSDIRPLPLGLRPKERLALELVPLWLDRAA